MNDDDSFDAHWKHKNPWVVVDPLLNREWVIPQPLKYYVVHNPAEDIWFICDRQRDSAVHETESATREEAIRKFYKWCGRDMDKLEPVPYPMPGISHRGESG